MGLLLEEAHDDRIDLRAQSGDQLARALRLAEQLERDDLAGTFRDERRSPDEQLVGDAAERVQVGAVIDRARGTRLLGCHVQRRAHQRAGLRVPHVRRRGVRQLGDAEIEHLHAIAGAVRIGDEEHVIGLEIAVNDPLGVRGPKCTRDAASNRRGLELGQPAAVPEPGAQGLAVEQLHHEIRTAIDAVAEVVDLDDAGVADRGRRLGLVEEALDEDVVARQLGAQQLDRGGPIEELVLGAIDRAHAAARELRCDPIITQHFADQRITIRRLRTRLAHEVFLGFPHAARGDKHATTQDCLQLHHGRLG